MYSSPVIVCTVVSIRFYLRTKYPEFQWFKRENSDQRPSVDINRSNNPSLRSQKSVRRNARKEVVEWDRKVPTSLYDNLSSNTNFLEENSKLIFDEKEWTSTGRSSMEHGESCSHNEIGNDRALDDPNLLPGDGFQGQSGRGPDDGGSGGSAGQVKVERMEEGEDAEEEEEEVREDQNKAVEWMEDDQKNLMDLGALESECNKRLESLIAKRRAKKLFKMAVDKSLMEKDAILPSQLAPILIVKNSLLGFANNPNGEGLQMPGSAPSILLPTQNPFDLPYDPFEEKPNLMADSFQQEFMVANQKEMLFCRHESFCRGTSFTHDPNDAQFNPYHGTQRRLVEGPDFPRSTWQSDKGGGHHQHNSSGIVGDIDLVELEDSNHNEAMNSSEGKHETIRESAMDGIEIGGEKMGKPNLDLEPGLDSRNEVKMEIDSINNNDSCYSSSSEGTESVLDQTSKAPGVIHRDRMRKALNLLIPPKGKTVNVLPYDSSPSPSERHRMDFNLFYSTYRRHCHTPTRSIASDLQVEVSEVGSPPLTTDGTVSSVDGDSVTYDGDVDRDINSDGEELWGGSFNLSRGEANREKLRELHDIIEEDSVEVELSDLNRKPEEPIAFLSPSELEAKQNLDSKISPSSIIEMTENVASHPTNINPETHEDTKKIDEVEGFKTFNVSKTLSPENPGKTMHLMENLEVHSPSESCYQKPEQLIEPHQKPTEELNIICNVKLITRGDSSTLDSKSSKNRENGAQILIETAEEMRKPAEAINLDSSEYRHGNLETSYESKRTMESEKEMKESQLSKYIEEDMTAQDNTQILEPEHDNGDASNSAPSRDNLPVPDSIFDQNVAGNNVSEVKQRLGGSIAMALNPRLLIEQMYVGSFSSPRSVLPQNVLEDHMPLSDVEQLIQTDEPQSVMEDTARDSLADDKLQENITVDMPQNAEHLVENSIDCSSSNSRLGTLEGSSKMTEKTTNYSIVDNMTEHVVEDSQGKEDSSIKSSEGESKTSMNLKDAKEQSKPSSESNPGFIEHLEGGSENLVEYDNGIGPPKSEEENAKSDDPETMVGKEEATNSPRKVIGEGNVVINIDNSEVNKKGEGELTTDECESRFSIGLEAIRGPGKPNQHEVDLNKAEANEGQNPSLPESASEKEKSAAEVDLTSDMNDSFANNVTNIDILNHHFGGESEPQILSREAAVIEPSKATGATSAGSVEDTEHETERLTEAEENAGLSTSAGESNSLKNTKNGEEIVDAPESQDSLKAIESKLAMETSKATGATNAESVEDSEHETERLTKDEANAGLSTSAGETNSLNNIKNGGQDGIIDATLSKEDDNLDAIESKVAMEASKPMESEVEVVNPEGDRSNAMAK